MVAGWVLDVRWMGAGWARRECWMGAGWVLEWSLDGSPRPDNQTVDLKPLDAPILKTGSDAHKSFSMKMFAAMPQRSQSTLQAFDWEELDQAEAAVASAMRTDEYKSCTQQLGTWAAEARPQRPEVAAQGRSSPTNVPLHAATETAPATAASAPPAGDAPDSAPGTTPKSAPAMKGVAPWRLPGAMAAAGPAEAPAPADAQKAYIEWLLAQSRETLTSQQESDLIVWEIELEERVKEELASPSDASPPVAPQTPEEEQAEEQAKEQQSEEQGQGNKDEGQGNQDDEEADWSAEAQEAVPEEAAETAGADVEDLRMAVSVCVVENRGIYSLASGPVMARLWGQLFAARQRALQQRNPPCPSAGGVVLSLKEVADAMSWMRATFFDREPRELEQKERDRQSGLRGHQLRGRSQSRFHVALLQRYGGDLLSRTVVARGEVSEATLAAINRVAWDRHVAAGSVRTRGPPQQAQKPPKKKRGYTSAMALRKEAKQLLSAAEKDPRNEDLQRRANDAAQAANEATRSSGHGGRLFLARPSSPSADGERRQEQWLPRQAPTFLEEVLEILGGAARPPLPAPPWSQGPPAPKASPPAPSGGGGGGQSSRGSAGSQTRDDDQWRRGGGGQSSRGSAGWQTRDDDQWRHWSWRWWDEWDQLRPQWGTWPSRGGTDWQGDGQR